MKVNNEHRSIPESKAIFEQGDGPRTSQNLKRGLIAVMTDVLAGRITVREANALNKKAGQLIKNFGQPRRARDKS